MTPPRNNMLATTTSSSDHTIMKDQKVRQRASRACLNCRELKIKCESSNDGNCVRCNREGKSCVFVTSKRGGHYGKNRSNSFDNDRILNKLSKHIDNNKHSLDVERTSDGNKRRKSEDISLTTIQNPSDSLNLLAQAAFKGNDYPVNTSTDNIHDQNNELLFNSKQIYEQEVAKSRSNSIHSSSSSSSSSSQDTSNSSPNERLKKFCLVERGILTPTTFKTLISTYFIRHHQYMPVLPAHRVLRSDSELCDLAENEPILAITFVIIASRFENSKIHQESWSYMSSIIQDLTLGIIKPTLGAIESLLTLSENVPILKQVVNHKELYELEERFSWNLVGQAVRLSYYLGLDQKTLLEPNDAMSEETHRMRFIWTYCHLEERQTSIRFGKAFWTRGPTLCFPGIMGQSYLNNNYNDHDISTTLIPSVHTPDAYSSYIQAIIDSTNLMSNIHDLLYPSRDRTISLVNQGDYHKILDEFTMGFTTYKLTWNSKNWDILSLNETVWVSFNYAKLYAYGFAFEAHMKRATENSSNGTKNVKKIFPKTMVASPDAKFIIEAKNAAVEILKSCSNNLRSYGAMAYLPARYYGYFGHSAVFLIKIIFTGAVCYKEQKEILDLIGKLIECFCDEFKSLDRYHPLIRCAQQLKILMQTLWTSSSNPHNESHSDEQIVQPDTTFQDDLDLMSTCSDSLTGDIFNLVDNFTFDHFSPNLIDESAEAATQELTSYFTNDLNSNVWLSYFHTPKPNPF
ncbi:Transcriptional activator ARO80 [Wickerhamomyces ciferrii]|uniref:Transcriptional activator ARO80 n=1 Tax=Wickerhamomyces ciferrii (strain ATCC 14091 / BCRC 22168 / CBS 111 / JCM 3599 / NBRC 0793 / NRRL Y-1031 F-60-10) TaxID=1206466 RepID=K0KCN6_WICCF|nr:Transcriptional activator ARO80 [Wickerhamomyces ciferrii]CCH42840.1 Transcriptional activator ARO80 [Wickerhamomyces ciferrii]